MMQNERVTRRAFLRWAVGVGLAAPLFVRSTAFGANDRITSGIIGLGGPAGGGDGRTELLAGIRRPLDIPGARQ
jgi:hypothetical protein